MHAQTKDREPIRVNGYKIGAIVAQGLSLAATYAFIATAIEGADTITLGLIAVAVEGLLALAKSAIFRQRRKDGAVGVFAFGFDSLLNAGGLWPVAKNFGKTPPAVMLAEWLGLSTDANIAAAGVLALLLGALLSALPWYLWRAGDDDD